MIDLKNKRVLFLDFDGTLVETKSGNTFPNDLTDMVLKMDVLNRIADLVVENDIKIVGICSNQGGVELGYVDFLDINAKIGYVSACINDLVRHKREDNKGIDCLCVRICTSNDKADQDRKPNPGMLEDVMYIADNMGLDFDKSQMLMVGDASGFVGQFSDSDRRCAENFGIDYLDVVDFVGKDLAQELILTPGKLKNGPVEFIPEEGKVIAAPNPYSVKRTIWVRIRGYVRSDRLLSSSLNCTVIQNPYAGKVEYLLGDIIKLSTI